MRSGPRVVVDINLPQRCIKTERTTIMNYMMMSKNQYSSVRNKENGNRLITTINRQRRDTTIIFSTLTRREFNTSIIARITRKSSYNNNKIEDYPKSIRKNIYPIKIESNEFSSSPKGHNKKRKPSKKALNSNNPVSPYIERLVSRIPKVLLLKR